MAKLDIPKPLNDAFLRKIKASPKDYTGKKFPDGGGLYYYVSPAGGTLWQMAYRFNGKQKTISFGEYPIISLRDARDKLIDAKRLIRNGKDPLDEKAKATAKANTSNTFETIAREWHNKQKDSITEKYAAAIISRLDRHVFPSIGSKNIDDITTKELKKVVEKIENEGSVETAHRVLQICGRVFCYAINSGATENERNPASNIKGTLKKVNSKNFASITDPKEIGYLLRDIDNYNGSLAVKAALQLLPYVFVRSGELRHAEWKEINLDTAEWRIPASKMKMKEIHIVPLSNQAVEILKTLKPRTDYSEFIFPSPWQKTRSITDVALLNALRRMGYEKGVMTVHGFRSMASTLLNEQGYNRDWIERQLAHGEQQRKSSL